MSNIWQQIIQFYFYVLITLVQGGNLRNKHCIEFTQNRTTNLNNYHYFQLI